MIGRKWMPVSVCLLALAAPVRAQDRAGSYYHFSRAKLADFEMRFADAISEFEKALALDPNEAGLRVEYAATLMKAGQVERAVEQCRKAIQLNPESAEAHFLLGQIHKNALEAGANDKMAEAIAEFKRVVELDQNHFEALFYLGQLLYYNGSYEESAATFGRFITLRPNIPKAYNYRAGALVKLGEIHGAIEVLEESLKLEDNPENLELLARLYEETEMGEKASEAYQRALAVAPTTEVKYRAAMNFVRLGRYSEAVPLLRDVVQDVPGEHSFKVELGKALEGSAAFSEAVDAFQAALAADPDNVEANYYLASSLRALGRRPEAIERVKKLLKVVEKGSGSSEQAKQLLVRFKSFLAVLYQESRQFDLAVSLFRELVQANPDDYRSRLGLAYALKDAGNLQEALAVSQDLLQLRPDDLDVLITRARMLSASGQLEAAAALLNEQLQREPERDDQEDLYLAVSQLYAEHKMYSRAESAILRAVQEFPDSQRVQFQLGALLERQGKHKEAEDEFRSILEENPEHAAVLNYLGYMLADRGVRLQEALGYVERALAIEPHNGAYLDSLGWVYFKLDRLEQAESKLIEAARINDADPTIYEHLGDLYLKLGNYPKARVYYERSVLFAEDPAEREKVQGKLASLNKLMAPERD